MDTSRPILERIRPILLRAVHDTRQGAACVADGLLLFGQAAVGFLKAMLFSLPFIFAITTTLPISLSFCVYDACQYLWTRRLHQINKNGFDLESNKK